MIFFLSSSVKESGSLTCSKLGIARSGTEGGGDADLTESLLEILRDHAEGRRGGSSPKFDTWAGLLLGGEESGLGGHCGRRARTESTKAAEKT